MASPRKRTPSADRRPERRRRAPAAPASAYQQGHAIVDSTEALIGALDEARLINRMSKAELSRMIGARPEIVRRLLTDERSNPTLKTVMKLAAALGLHVELVQNKRTG